MRQLPYVLVIGLFFCSCAISRGADQPLKLTFQGVLSEHRLALKDLGDSISDDWTGYSHLVMEMRTSSPQRFGLWVYTKQGPRRVEIQPFGQNVWLRASVPLQYLVGRDSRGTDLASATNRRTDSFWMSVWGPFGELKDVEAVGLAMDYPINNPTIELRNVHLSKSDEGSKFLVEGNVLDEFNQWAAGDWSRKIKSREQLEKELADEEKAFGSAADFGYGKFGGYQSTQAKATGFFRVEQINGAWWFIDPEGHYFLSTSSNGIGGGGGRGGARGGARGAAPASAPSPQQSAAANRTNRRLDSWGMNTGGQGRPNIVMLRWNINAQTTFLGLPDVYAADFAAGIDASANQQCTTRKEDQMLIGYFIGNEPPWGERESEVVNLILAGPDTGTKAKLKEFLAQGDTPKRRVQFVVDAFDHYLNLICTAVKKYDPNHLILGIRFGGKPADEVLRAARVFDVCSINVYEYEPTKQLERSYRLSGRPLLIGEFHIGVPENGLGAGLVQAMNQTERGIAYRYFVEQGMSLPYCLGAHWFTWQDEPVLGRFDGENYNIGLIDVTGRPYQELIDAARQTHKRLMDVHSGKVPPFSQRPRASESGTPSSPWSL